MGIIQAVLALGLPEIMRYLTLEQRQQYASDIDAFQQNRMRFFDRQIAAVAGLSDIDKQPTFSVALMGKTCTGKTTLINALFKKTLPTGPIRTTEGVQPVVHNDDVTIYDVHGESDDATYHDLAHLMRAKSLDLIVVVYTDAVETVLNLARLCQALRVNLIFFRNKCEQFTDEEHLKVREHDTAKLCQYVTAQEFAFVIGAADPPKNLDWLRTALRAPSRVS